MSLTTATRALGGVLLTHYDRVRYRLRFQRNPVVYIVVGGGLAAMTLYHLLNGMAPGDLLSERYVEYLIVTGSGIIARLKAWAPQTVEDEIAARDAHDHGVEFDPTLLEPTEGDG